MLLSDILIKNGHNQNKESSELKRRQEMDDKRRVRPAEVDYKRPHRVHNTAAVSITLPNNEKEDRLNYLDQYSCKPPPLIMLILSLSQVKVIS